MLIKASTTRSYYSEGKYETEFREMTEKLMPDSGDSDTLVGQILTSLNRLSYDYYNNGNGNITDYVVTRDEEWSDEIISDEEGDYVISDFYQSLFDTLKDISSDVQKIVEDIENFCCLGEISHSFQFSEENKSKYNLLIDLCMEAILTGKIEDKVMPKRYE
jgi:hypothetical protein